jgi:hypothetical protein
VHLKWHTPADNLDATKTPDPSKLYHEFCWGESLMVADVDALARTALDDPRVVNVFIEFTKFVEGFGGGREVRPRATAALGETAKAQPGQVRRIVQALVEATQFEPRSPHSNRGDHGKGVPPPAQKGDGEERQGQPHVDARQCVAAVNALAAIGPAARDAIPVLRKLKLSPQMAIRQAAIAALEKINPEP